MTADLSQKTQPSDPNGRPITVLYLIDDLDVGGTEQQILELIKRLDRARYRAVVCCLNCSGRIADEIRQTGVPVLFVLKRSRYDFMIVHRLMVVMREYRVRIVHTFLFTANTWGRLAAVLARVPIRIASERNVDLWKRAHHHAIDTVLSWVTDEIIVNATAIESWLLQSSGISSRKVRVIHNGVDLARFESTGDAVAARRTLVIDPEAPVLGVLARLEEQKGHRYLFEALLELSRHAPKITVLLIGDGALRVALEQTVRQLGIEHHVRFLGTRRDIANVLSVIDIVVLPSLWEGCSNTILEAMAMARPVVATRVGGNPELVIDGVTGRLVPPADPVALAAALRELVERPALAKQMGLEGRRRVERVFHADVMAAATQASYDALVNPGGSDNGTARSGARPAPSAGWRDD